MPSFADESSCVFENIFESLRSLQSNPVFIFCSVRERGIYFRREEFPNIIWVYAKFYKSTAFQTTRYMWNFVTAHYRCLILWICTLNFCLFCWSVACPNQYHSHSLTVMLPFLSYLPKGFLLFLTMFLGIVFSLTLNQIRYIFWGSTTACPPSLSNLGRTAVLGWVL